MAPRTDLYQFCIHFCFVWAGSLRLSCKGPAAGGEALKSAALCLHSGKGLSSTSVNPHCVKLHCECKVAVKQLQGGPPIWFSNKRCSRRGKTLTFDEKMCFTSAPRVAALAADFAPIRCTGTAYADFRFKSAAQASHLLTFASISL